MNKNAPSVKTASKAAEIGAELWALPKTIA
jgi:hypothetical protein